MVVQDTGIALAGRIEAVPFAGMPEAGSAVALATAPAEGSMAVVAFVEAVVATEAGASMAEADSTAAATEADTVNR
jgi:hypothetical protein